MDDHLALRAEANAFRPHAMDRLEREVDDAPFARIHWIEFERLAGGLDPFGGGASHHFQFFDAQGAVAGAVQEDFVLERRFEAKSAKGQMFDGLEEFGATLEQ